MCSSIPLPSTSYPLFDSLRENIITEGKLSQLQLEGVLYACAKHQELLPSGHSEASSIPLDRAQAHYILQYRPHMECHACTVQLTRTLHACHAGAGFFIGDGAGVGKGRQIAGIILDNYVRGRRRAVWLSTSTVSASTHSMLILHMKQPMFTLLGHMQPCCQWQVERCSRKLVRLSCNASNENVANDAWQDLHHDATRDLRALGCHVNIINNCQELDRETKVFGLAKDMQEGVLFMY